MVPGDYWRSFFLSSYPVLTKFWSPVVGPFVAIHHVQHVVGAEVDERRLKALTGSGDVVSR